MIAWMLLAASGVFSGTVHDHFDVVEVNHVYDKSGEVLFDQLIWRNWHKSGHRVEAWKLIRDGRDTSDDDARKRWEDRIFASGQLMNGREFKGTYVGGPLHPQKVGDLYVVTFCDGVYTRRITARTFVETWTVGDNEVKDRKWMAEEDRAGLKQIPVAGD